MKLGGWSRRAPLEQITGAKLRPKRRAMLVKASLWLIGVVIVFALLGFFVVPPVAKHYLVKDLSELLGRQVTIREISVNPFAMTAKIRGLVVQEPNRAEPFVSFDSLSLNLQAQSIIRLAPIVDDIRLEHPFVHVVRLDDGRYNFSDLLDKFSQPTPTKKDSKPAKFSLNNIVIAAGEVQFEDKPKKARHSVSDINVAVPFVSNLPYLVDKYVQPSFSAKLNGAPFVINGRTKPFQSTLETQVAVDVDAVDIPRYMEYVPVELGFRIPSASLDTRLSVKFVRYPDRGPALLLAGTVTLHKLSVTQTDKRPLANVAKIQVPVDAISVFAREVKLGNVLIEDPELFVRREHDGSLNWAALAGKTGNAHGAAPAKVGADPENNSDPELAVTVTEIKLERGRVHFVDENTASPFKTDVDAAQVAVRGFALPQKDPMTLEASFATGFSESAKAKATVVLSPLQIEGDIELGKIAAKNYAPYYAPLVLVDVQDGVIDASTHFRAEQKPSGLSAILSGLQLSIGKLRLRKRGASEDFFSAQQTDLHGLDFDLEKRTLQVAEVSSTAGKLHAAREKNGSIDLATLAAPSPQVAAKARNAAEKVEQKTQDQSWHWLIKKASLDRYAVTFDDRALSREVTHSLDPIKVTLENLSSQRDSTAKVAAQLGINKSGKVVVTGRAGITPIKADLDLDVRGVDLVPLEPYFGDKLNILITSGDVLAKGALTVRTLSTGALGFTFKGDAGANNFASVDNASSEEFLNWKTLYVSGIDTATEPFSLAVQQVALSDFYSRLIIHPTGRLNVQDVMAKGSEAEIPPAGSAQAKTSADAKAGKARKDATPAKTTVTPPPDASPSPPITIGKVTLQAGNINFTDLFIKPNYSANLTEIGGAITGLSSQLDTTADVDVRGRFAKTAPVSIKGKVNPLIKNLFLDLTADVQDIELGPFTPYSAKYVGYAIEKGKMAFNVHYKVVNRELTAQNKLVLNQLTFGDKVESPTATKLPVLLAVSLLKDRNGVIDVNLPIRGSLDDPQFSVGGIIIKIIFNLIEKAVTAPFALIGSLFGGSGEELSFIDFPPGRATLIDTSEEKLTKLRTALTERPGLKLDITGHADPQTDREGMRKLRLDQQVKAQRLKELVKSGSSVASLDDVTIEPAQYEKYLKRAYQDAKFPKPRNAIGLAKDLPKDEMEKLMLTNLTVSDDDLIELANKRAQSAKDFITRDNQVAVDRVFLLAPKLQPGKGDGRAPASRVEFSLK